MENCSLGLYSVSPSHDFYESLSTPTEADHGLMVHVPYRSILGRDVTIIGENQVIWASRLHAAIALSAVEAEFYALSQPVREIRWIRDLLPELGALCDVPTTVFQGNMATLSFTLKPVRGRNSRHIGVRYHIVKEDIQSGDLCVEYSIQRGVGTL